MLKVLSIVVHNCKFSTQKMETGISGGQQQLCREFEVNLSYMRIKHCLEKRNPQK